MQNEWNEAHRHKPRERNRRTYAHVPQTQIRKLRIERRKSQRLQLTRMRIIKQIGRRKSRPSAQSNFCFSFFIFIIFFNYRADAKVAGRSNKNFSFYLTKSLRESRKVNSENA